MCTTNVSKVSLAAQMQLTCSLLLVVLDPSQPIKNVFGQQGALCGEVIHLST